MYESYYLNFISPVPRSLLEDIAQAAIAANCVNLINKVHFLDFVLIKIKLNPQQIIAKVFDQYLNFISLDDEIFCLRHQNKDLISYYCKYRLKVLEIY